MPPAWRPLLLASASPRRADLLRGAGIPFDVGPAPDIDETPAPGMPPEEVVQVLAREKARRVAARLPDRTVLAADTVVVVDGEILGKPRDAAEAVAMLRRLSGRPHRVHTGIAISRAGQVRAAVESAEVVFRPLTDAEIRAYVATGESLDKAGAYAIQGGAAPFVERLSGGKDTVMGLPVAGVRRLLRESGLDSDGRPGR